MTPNFLPIPDLRLHKIGQKNGGTGKSLITFSKSTMMMRESTVQRVYRVDEKTFIYIESRKKAVQVNSQCIRLGPSRFLSLIYQTLEIIRKILWTKLCVHPTCKNEQSLFILLWIPVIQFSMIRADSFIMYINYRNGIITFVFVYKLFTFPYTYYYLL